MSKNMKLSRGLKVNNQSLKKIPNKPGVYLFYSKKNELIYVGKATSLKNRVKSYFSGLKSPRPIELMIHEVSLVKYQITDSVLEAVILEGNLIKKYRPKYNVMWKDDKSWNYFVIEKGEYPKVATLRERELRLIKKDQLDKKFSRVFGPYPGLNVKAALKILRRIFHISFCKPGSKRACLYREMGECMGVCTGELSGADYRKKVISPLILFLSGKKINLIKNIIKEMDAASRYEDFEEAARLRDQQKALQRIRDIALINDAFVREKFSRFKKAIRIEGYDISNLGASGKVGSMVVFDNHGPVKNDYRKFIIYTVAGQSDVDCLGEVIERRLKHTEWPFPAIFLVDGGLPQINRASKIIKGKGLNIPIVGIAKGPERKKADFIYKIKNPAVQDWISVNKNLLIRVRDEAHRFAISFQRQKRKLRS